MPVYQFKNTKTDEVVEKTISYAEKVKFLEENPEWQSHFGKVARLVYDPGTRIKVSDSHREAIARIKERLPVNNITDH